MYFYLFFLTVPMPREALLLPANSTRVAEGSIKWWFRTSTAFPQVGSRSQLHLMSSTTDAGPEGVQREERLFPGILQPGLCTG